MAGLEDLKETNVDTIEDLFRRRAREQAQRGFPAPVVPAPEAAVVSLLPYGCSETLSLAFSGSKGYIY